MHDSSFTDDSSAALGLSHAARLTSGGIARWRADLDAEHEAALRAAGIPCDEYGRPIIGDKRADNAGAADAMGELLNAGYTVEQARQYLIEHPEAEAQPDDAKDAYLGASVRSLMDRNVDGRHGRSRGRSRGGKRGTKPICKDCHLQYCNCPTRERDGRLREVEPRSVFRPARVTPSTDRILDEAGIKASDGLAMLARAIESGDFAALGNAILNHSTFDAEKALLKDSA